VDVTKVVDLVTRIPEKLSLYFSEFSTNLYRFYKFTGKTRKHIHKFAKRALGLAQNPLEDLSFSQKGPWPEQREQRRRRRPKSGEARRRRQGPVGERQEGT
jgi:hypothetical protein